MAGDLILSYSSKNVLPPPLHNQNFSFLPPSEGRGAHYSDSPPTISAL